MNDELTQPEYSLDELLSILEECKKMGDGYLNIPKAFMCLSKEIIALQGKICPYPGEHDRD